jgi:hypothetical protein
MTYEEDYYRDKGFRKHRNYFMNYHDINDDLNNQRYRLLMLDGFLNNPKVPEGDKVSAAIHTIAVMKDKSKSEFTKEWALEYIESAKKNMTQEAIEYAKRSIFSRIAERIPFC